VVRGVGNGKASLTGERLHGVLPLGEDFEQFQSPRTGNRLSDPGKLGVEKVFGPAL
jgi:hypothetical protein